MAEAGFYHPERGYWQAIALPDPQPIYESQPIPDTDPEEYEDVLVGHSDPLADLLASYPEGTVEVPLKPGADYEWDGEEWQHVTPPEPTPEERRAAMPEITARQLRLTLRRGAGITPAMVESAIASIEDEGEREDALIEWEYASRYERLHPLIAQVADALELTDEAVDALWDQALTA